MLVSALYISNDIHISLNQGEGAFTFRFFGQVLKFEKEINGKKQSQAGKMAPSRLINGLYILPLKDKSVSEIENRAF